MYRYPIRYQTSWERSIQQHPLLHNVPRSGREEAVKAIGAFRRSPVSHLRVDCE
ncbi:uncharacterized protein B0I36DRAFT_279428 [Microdochium trichocladiopsis]|uniref:Uncharacterized protein n=1 Tax=Microdochium trichocladiopsis TaxID=1682393 RepID=A0A9P8XPN9_9PEZI|nr:uncharacterized protein B0I36DRAFT_279428 [Microdochium trichocladiopsis]KAH7009379.1 hypothetical protein B0I36DRAFT_279428 [Microdochium trichocladiopsis]